MSSSVDEHRASFDLPGFGLPRLDLPHFDLEWLAVRYVLDELSIADRDAFEVRLADDLSACEAVAAASRFVLASQAAFIKSAANTHATSACASAQFVPVASTSVQLAASPLAASPLTASRLTTAASRRSATGSSINSWLAVVATSAAMAMLLLFAVQAPVPLQPDAEIAGSSSSNSNVEPQAAELVSLWRSGMDANDDDAEDLEEMADISSDVAVPGWLLAAVSFETPGPVEGSREKLQEN
jgi:hypothetical protein